MRSRDKFDIIEIASQKLRILSLLGENNISLSYLTQHIVSGKKYVLNIVPKPSFAEVKPILVKKQSLFEEIFAHDEEIKLKYREYSSKAGLEMYTSALSAQVYLQTKLLSSSYHHLPKLAYTHQDDSAWYLVLDYIEGRNIYDYLNELESKDEELILSLMQKLISALSSTNEFSLGPLLYANLTPSNIIIDGSGELYLVDFFKLRFTQEDSVDNIWQLLISENSPGPFLPIEGYSDFRSEIYAFGVLFYYCLTGVFIQNSKERLKNDRLIPLGSISEKYSVKLEKILSFCLELAPERRFQSFKDLKTAVLSESFGSVLPYHLGRHRKSLFLGNIPRNTERKITFNLKKGVKLSAVPFMLEKFNCEWTLKSELEAPVLELLHSQEHKNELSLTLKLLISDTLPPGRYEAKCSFMTTWGNAEIKVFFEIFSLSPLLYPPMGMLYALIFVLFLFCFQAKDEPSRLKWGKSFWTLVKAATGASSIYNYEAAEHDFWMEYPDEKGVEFIDNNLKIAYESMKKYEKRGVLSSFYSPVSARTAISANFACKFKDESLEKASIMLFSSNSSSLSVSFEDVKKATVSLAHRGKILEKKDIDISKMVSSNSNNIEIKIEYFIPEYSLVCNVGNETVAFENVELVDYALFLYGASLIDKYNVDINFSDIRIEAGSALAKIPPYYMASSGKYSVFFKDDDKSPRVFTVLKDELLEVCEVRGDWLRVRQSSAKTEGWIHSERMRVPKPFETIP